MAADRAKPRDVDPEKLFINVRLDQNQMGKNRMSKFGRLSFVIDQLNFAQRKSQDPTSHAMSNEHDRAGGARFAARPQDSQDLPRSILVNEHDVLVMCIAEQALLRGPVKNCSF